MTATNKKTKGLRHQGVHSNWAEVWQNKAQAGIKPHAQREHTLGLKLSSVRHQLMAGSLGAWVSYLLTEDQHTQLRALLWGLNEMTNTRVGLGSLLPPTLLLSHHSLPHNQSLAGASSPPTGSTDLRPQCGQRMPPATRMNKGCCSYQPQRPPPTVQLKGFRTQENRILPGPRQLRCVSKEWFQWAQTLVSSHTQKSAEVINLRCLFFL